MLALLLYRLAYRRRAARKLHRLPSPLANRILTQLEKLADRPKASQHQIIEKDKKPEWAVLPYEEYLRLAEAQEILEDVSAYQVALADRDEEQLPHELVRELVESSSPIPVWRRHRGLTQEQLAGRAGIRKAYLSQIETGRRTGSVKVLAALAEALDVEIEDLLPREIRDEPD